MPQNKRKQFHFLPKLVLRDLLAKFEAKEQARLPECIDWLVFFACHSKALTDQRLSREQQLFLNSIATQPDMCLKILAIARKLAAKHRRGPMSNRKRAIDFFLNHNCLIKKAGKFFLYDDPRLTDADRKPSAYVVNPTDGEVAQFLNLPLATVHEARQHLSVP